MILPNASLRFAGRCRRSTSHRSWSTRLRWAGRRRDTEARVVRAGDNTILVLVRDITERKRAEKELRRSSEQIRELAGKLMTAQEEERNRVARELHDDVMQRVAALSIYMSNLKRSIPERQIESCRNSAICSGKLPCWPMTFERSRISCIRLCSKTPASCLRSGLSLANSAALKASR